MHLMYFPALLFAIFSSLIAFLSSVDVVTAAPAAGTSSIKNNAAAIANQDIVPGRYVFEFTGGPSVDTNSRMLMNFLKKTFPKVRLLMPRVIDHGLLKAVTIHFERTSHTGSTGLLTSSISSDEQNAAFTDIARAVSTLGFVAHVYPVHSVHRPDTRIASIPLESADAALISPNAQTQIDRVHSELRNTGKGLTVGIIDTGVDYMHPALGGGFGPGYKVALGRDLVGDDYDGYKNTTPIPDLDPIDSCSASTGSSGHGTHVSGIVAGKSDNFTGAAPDATLGMWRVFGCTGSTDDDIIIEAMLDAYDAGVDIISMSLGDAQGWPEMLSAIVASRINAKGVPGNDGEHGAFTSSAPSVGKGVYSVASFDNNYNVVQTFDVMCSSPECKKTYVYNLGKGSDSMPSGQVVAGDINIGSTMDACDPANIPRTVSGKLALVQRGTCEFEQKTNNLAQAGAIGALIYNIEGEGSFIPGVKDAKIPLAGVAHETGVELLEDIQQGETYLTFKGQQQAAPTTTGNIVSSFSSIGPSYELGVNPNIAGVGGLVYSTLPRQLGSWGVLSGTSMATPQVAGAVALYLKSIEGKGPRPHPTYILEQFQNYAYKAPNKNGQENVDTPYRQGAGLIQVYDTIRERVHITPGDISFNDTANMQKTHTLTITNEGATPVFYKAINKISVSIIPYDSSSGYQFTEPPVFGTESAEIKFSQTNIQIAPGASVKITVSVVPPNTDPAKHIMYGGYIQLKSIGNDNYGSKDITVPYVGIVGNQHELPIYGNGTPQLTADTNPEKFTPINQNTVFVYDRKSGPKPTFMITLVSPTREISTPLYTENNVMIGYATFNEASVTNLARSISTRPVHAITWDGTYTPTLLGIRVPITFNVLPGKYRIGLNALKWFGVDEWDNWTSGIIEVR
ncbi:peptidase S8/S53 domain-containing protein [Zychaea mexicana]|uniref:peptidase S8/S53 domain-containing protein n=1 Tax=Zychaea mexicana TaxID=64656 RepID=UPI0022FEE5EC|nr:peptidase S8/S53 domain-containing protein [Zychaea mexicana]KAI9488328.1 peptidase S8/S53 domain-containing protein [Zychaea mexicana]